MQQLEKSSQSAKNLTNSQQLKDNQDKESDKDDNTNLLISNAAARKKFLSAAKFLTNSQLFQYVFQVNLALPSKNKKIKNMSTDYLRCLLTELVKIYNPTCDGTHILDMIDQDNQFRESEMMTLRQQINLLRLSLDSLDKQYQLNEIELKLNINANKLYSDALLENYESKVGVSVLDDEWNFIIMDDVSKQLLELHKQKDPNFYKLLPEFCKTSMNDYQLKDSRKPQVFNFSVFSKKNRKNATRKFTRYLKPDQKEIKLKNKFEAELLHTIYYKQIETTMQRYSIYVDNQFCQQLCELNLQSTHNLKQGWQEVVLVYFKEVIYENHLTLQQVRSDNLVNGYQGVKVKAIKYRINSSPDDHVTKQIKKSDDSSFDMESFNLDESDYTYTPDHILY